MDCLMKHSLFSALFHPFYDLLLVAMWKMVLPDSLILSRCWLECALFQLPEFYLLKRWPNFIQFQRILLFSLQEQIMASVFGGVA